MVSNKAFAFFLGARFLLTNMGRTPPQRALGKINWGRLQSNWEAQQYSMKLSAFGIFFATNSNKINVKSATITVKCDSKRKGNLLYPIPSAFLDKWKISVIGMKILSVFYSYFFHIQPALFSLNLLCHFGVLIAQQIRQPSENMSVSGRCLEML